MHNKKQMQRIREWGIYQLIRPARFIFEWWMKRKKIVLLYCIMGNGLGDAMAISTILNAMHEKYGTRGIVFSMHPDLFLHNPQVVCNLSYKAMGSTSRSLFKILLRALRGPNVICIGGEVWTLGTNPLDTRDIKKQKKIGWNWLQSLLPDYQPPINYQDIYPRIYFSEEEEQRFMTKFMNLNQSFAALKASVGVNRPKGTYLKDWDLKKVAEVVARTPQVRWVQLGDEKETHIPGTLNLLGQTSIRETMWLVKESRFLLSVEGFITHVSAAFNIPAITLMTGAYDPNAFVYRNTIPIMAKPMPQCSPCWSDVCVTEGKPCMTNISVEAVIEKVSALIDKES